MKTAKHVALILDSILVAILVTIATIPATAQTDQTFEKAVAAYEQDDYVMAFILFGAAAEEGHPEAQFGLGVMYACCFPLYLVRSPSDLTGLFGRRIS